MCGLYSLAQPQYWHVGYEIWVWGGCIDIKWAIVTGTHRVGSLRRVLTTHCAACPPMSHCFTSWLFKNVDLYSAMVRLCAWINTLTESEVRRCDHHKFELWDFQFIYTYIRWQGGSSENGDQALHEDTLIYGAVMELQKRRYRCRER